MAQMSMRVLINIQPMYNIHAKVMFCEVLFQGYNDSIYNVIYF